MTIVLGCSPGAYLRDMREADGKSVHDVAQVLRMLKLCGFNGIWPVSRDLEGLLTDIEGGGRAPSPDQLRSLTLAFPFRLARYRELARLRSKEAVDV